MAHLGHLPGALGVINPPVVGMNHKMELSQHSKSQPSNKQVTDLAAKTRPISMTKQIPTLRRYSWRVLSTEGAAAIRLCCDVQVRIRLDCLGLYASHFLKSLGCSCIAVIKLAWHTEL